jgi:hypothetical protein
MKKGAFISLIFAFASFFAGIIIILHSLSLVTTPMSIQDYNASISASITYSSLQVDSLMPLMLIVLGCTLFLAALILLILSIYLFLSQKSILKS